MTEYNKVVNDVITRFIIEDLNNYKRINDATADQLIKLDKSSKKYASAQGIVDTKIKDISISNMGLLGTMRLNNAELSSYIKRGGRFNNVMGGFAAKTRMALHGLRGFRMELLGVMFFGMAVSGMIMRMMKPAMDAFGLSSLWSSAMLLLFLPIMSILAPKIMDLITWIMDWKDSTKLLVGGSLVLIGVLFGLLFIVGTVGLGLGALILLFSKSEASLILLGLKVDAGTSIFSAFATKITGPVMSALAKLNIALKELTIAEIIAAGPLILLGIAIVVLAWMWYKNIWNMREQTGVVFNGIYSIIRLVVMSIITVFVTALGIILGIFDVLGRTIEGVVIALKDIIVGAFELAFNSAIDKIAKFMGDAISLYNSAAGFFGKDKLELGIDLTQYKMDVKSATDIAKDFIGNYDGVINKQVVNATNRIATIEKLIKPVDDLMYGIGNASIESGKQYEINKQIEEADKLNDSLANRVQKQSEEQYWINNKTTEGIEDNDKLKDITSENQTDLEVIGDLITEFTDLTKEVNKLNNSTTELTPTPEEITPPNIEPVAVDIEEFSKPTINLTVTQENTLNIDGGFDMDVVRKAYEENNEKNAELLKKSISESILNEYDNISRGGQQ